MAARKRPTSPKQPKRKPAAASKGAKRPMPSFTKAPPEVIAAFDAALAHLTSVERRTMFGYPAAFANGQMFGCVFQDRIMVRLGLEDRATALELPGAKLFEPMAGRPMREYVDLPANERTSAEALARWLARSQEYAKSLPPKPSRRAR